MIPATTQTQQQDTPFSTFTKAINVRLHSIASVYRDPYTRNVMVSDFALQLSQEFGRPIVVLQIARPKLHGSGDEFLLMAYPVPFPGVDFPAIPATPQPPPAAFTQDDNDPIATPAVATPSAPETPAEAPPSDASGVRRRERKHPAVGPHPNAGKAAAAPVIPDGDIATPNGNGSPS